MIKINKTLGLALLTALAASCSSDNDVAQSNNPTMEKGESAFATIRINLPTQSGTRAPSLEDGLPSEYAVNDGTLLVFKQVNTGDAEGAYKFVQSVDLGTMTPWENRGFTEITTSALTTVQLDQTSYADLKDGKIYGLVILNNGTGAAQKIKLPDVGTTFSTWNNDARNVDATKMLKTSNGIVMANAPEWKTAGVTPLTLVPIDGDMVHTTAAQAEAAGDVAANIYVERGLAKVTMEKDETSKNKFTPTGSTYKGDEVIIKGWVLDVTNKSSFPVHNVDLTSSYPDIWKEEGEKTDNNQIAKSAVNKASINRFHDATVLNKDEGDEVDNQTSIFRRVYWGKDPNYDQKITDVNVSQYFNLAKAQDLDKEDASKFDTHDEGSNPKYCLENTFDISNMTQNQTTRVLFKAIYLPGKIVGDPDGTTTGETFYKIGDQSGLYYEKDLRPLINTIVKNVTGKVVDKDYTLELGKIATEAGDHELSDANFKAVPSPAKAFTRGTEEAEAGDGTKNNILTTEQISNVNAQLNGKIKTYLNGVCYYIGRIKHFGNEETPWNQGDPTYNKDNLSWLGRYGVLRNNWYSLKVNNVSGPGEPVIPGTPDTPDDDNNFINLSVKILKWAKRGQVLNF